VEKELTLKYKPVAIYILYHQMFSEPNFIRDRRTIFKIPVEGSEKIIEKMLEIMLAQIKLWEKGEEIAFIKFLSKELGLNYQNIVQKYYERLEFLSDEQKQDKLGKMSLVYCDLLTEIMNKIKDDVLEQIYELIKINLTKEEFEELITELPDTEDAMFNIILNLAILKNFAKITNEPQPEEDYNNFVSDLITYLQKEQVVN
jgi:hypothetical protein